MSMLFDQAIPKSLAILISCGSSEQIECIGTRLWGLRLRMLFCGLFLCEGHGCRPIAKTNWAFTLQCPLHGLPFRRELGEWHERGKFCFLCSVQKHSDRWLQIWVCDELNQFIAFGRAFHENANGVEQIERLAQQCCRTRAVMP